MMKGLKEEALVLWILVEMHHLQVEVENQEEEKACGMGEIL